MDEQFGLFNFTDEKPPLKQPVSQAHKYKCGKLYEVTLGEICVNPDQPRKFFDVKRLEVLVDSVKRHGLLQPLVCTVDFDGQLKLAAGERRLRSAHDAGIHKVPVLVVSGDIAELSLVENLLREGLTVVEECEAAQSLRESKKYSLETMSKLLGRANSTVSEMLAVAGLPSEIRDDCRMNKNIPRDILVQISRLENDELKIASYEAYKTGKLSRRELKPVSSGNGVKTPKPHRIVARINKQFYGIDTSSISSKDRTNLRSELEKLRSSIQELLSKLDE